MFLILFNEKKEYQKHWLYLFQKYKNEIQKQICEYFKIFKVSNV